MIPFHDLVHKTRKPISFGDSVILARVWQFSSIGRIERNPEKDEFFVMGR
jgi:hypothetical protein